MTIIARCPHPHSMDRPASFAPLSVIPTTGPGISVVFPSVPLVIETCEACAAIEDVAFTLWFEAETDVRVTAATVPA